MGLLVNIVMMPCLEFWGRKWNLLDIATAVVFFILHCLCVMAPFHFTWPALWVACALYLVTGFGVTLSFHRNLAHKSFRLPKWLEYLFAYFGVLSLQGSPIEWVSSHRYHHQFTDTEKDVHSPRQGFWFSHMVGSSIAALGLENSKWKLLQYGGLKNLFYLEVYYMPPVEFLLGVGDGCKDGMRFPQYFVSKFSWSHVGWLGLFALGEGWHNNHHAFDYSARQGLEWWQIDFTWYVIRFFQLLGLATDVKTPTESQKRRKALN
ncbi:delta 9 desaturase 1, partial [Prunus dulcis]